MEQGARPPQQHAGAGNNAELGPGMEGMYCVDCHAAAAATVLPTGPLLEMVPPTTPALYIPVCLRLLRTSSAPNMLSSTSPRPGADVCFVLSTWCWISIAL